MEKLIFRRFILDITVFFLIASICLTLIVWIIQAVNYLDFVSEDGHSFTVYFAYSILSIPKIFSKLIIFVIFISIFYIISQYEENNEILIFWNHGIKKIKFVNVIIQFSVIVLLVQIFLNFFIVPKSLDLARSYIRDSNVDYFPSLIKPKQFIDTVEKLTVFIEKKNINGELENIFLKDKLKNDSSQIITADKGMIVTKNNNNFLILFNGKIVNIGDKDTNIIKFKKTEFNLSKFTTKTTTYPKIQELKSIYLISCIINLRGNREIYNFSNTGILSYSKFLKCNENSIKPISQELFKRLFYPLYIILVCLIASCLVLKSRGDFNYNFFRLVIFLFGIFSIILSEILIQYVNFQYNYNVVLIGIPIYLFAIIYLILILNKKSRLS